LGYEKPISTDAKAKILIGSFLPFSTASTHRDARELVLLCGVAGRSMAGIFARESSAD
jgi:hypothetical protein